MAQSQMAQSRIHDEHNQCDNGYDSDYSDDSDASSDSDYSDEYKGSMKHKSRKSSNSNNSTSKSVPSCELISKFLNKTENNWELSDFYGQTCQKSLQLFYNCNGRRTYAAVYPNGAVHIITQNADIAVEMFDSIKFAVSQVHSN